uniref:Movement protein n=1 Tax=Heterorhabditis bacteriophora TaxID=37862 RepID=A0A1I7WVL4_HETBA
MAGKEKVFASFYSQNCSSYDEVMVFFWWHWVAVGSAIICVSIVFIVCFFILCRRNSSSYEVSKAVLNQQGPRGGNEFYV